MFFLGKPNCMIQLFNKNQEELRQTIEKIRELFKDETIEIEITFAKNKEYMNTILSI